MKRRHSGFSMVEVLVTLVVIAIGVLGVAALQLNALKYTKESFSRSAASVLAGDLSDRMRGNMAGVKAGYYARNFGYTTAHSTAVTAPSCGTTSDCNAQTLAQLDLSSWLAAIAAALPGGTGAVVPVNNNAFVYRIVVMWQEKSLVDSSTIDASCDGPLVAGVRCQSVTFMP